MDLVTCLLDFRLSFASNRSIVPRLAASLAACAQLSALGRSGTPFLRNIELTESSLFFVFIRTFPMFSVFVCIISGWSSHVGLAEVTQTPDHRIWPVDQYQSAFRRQWRRASLNGQFIYIYICICLKIFVVLNTLNYLIDFTFNLWKMFCRVLLEVLWLLWWKDFLKHYRDSMSMKNPLLEEANSCSTALSSRCASLPYRYAAQAVSSSKIMFLGHFRCWWLLRAISSWTLFLAVLRRISGRGFAATAPPPGCRWPSTRGPPCPAHSWTRWDF